MIPMRFLVSTRRGQLVTACSSVILIALTVVLVSLVRFVHLMSTPEAAPPHTDAIVAFTGGPERVETALRLLAEGRAERLLLSGIGGGAELPELAHLAGVDPRPLAAHVTIDRNATTTRGNAVQTAMWARQNGINSLLVVTASYHMPRAITELSRALPEVTLYPLAVGAAGHEDGTVPLRLIAEEYVKFLASTAGLTAVLPARDPPAVHGTRAG